MTFLVDDVFKVINFVVEVGLIVYLVRRYGLIEIKNGIGAEKGILSNLSQQYTLWREKYADVSKKMKKNEEVFATMSEKFAMWNDKVAQAADKQLKICEQLQETAAENAFYKMKTIQHKALIHKELPEILAVVTQDLKQQFRNDNQLGRAYIQRVLDDLKE